MKAKQSLSSRIRGWFPQDPKNAKSAHSSAYKGHVVLEKKYVSIFGGLLSGFLVAIILVVLQKYEIAVAGFISTGLGTGLSLWKNWQPKKGNNS